jgi:hypothetical protein
MKWRQFKSTNMVELDHGGPKPTSKVSSRILNQRLFRFVLIASSVILMTGEARREVRAESQTARIVGLGATTCLRFNEDVRSTPSVQREYLAWAQGFMSGILVGRPPGVDQDLDLNPSSFDLIDQLHFLQDFCAKNPSANFADAIEALYKRLREEGKT